MASGLARAGAVGELGLPRTEPRPCRSGRHIRRPAEGSSGKGCLQVEVSVSAMSLAPVNLMLSHPPCTHRRDTSCSGHARPASLSLATCPAPSPGGRVLCLRVQFSKHKPASPGPTPQAPLLLGSRTPGHCTPAPSRPGQGPEAWKRPGFAGIIQSGHSCPRFSLRPLPVRDRLG